MWESIEVLFRCYGDGKNWGADEDIYNTLISDPLAGCCGILTAFALKKNFNIKNKPPKKFPKSFFLFFIKYFPHVFIF